MDSQLCGPTTYLDRDRKGSCVRVFSSLLLPHVGYILCPTWFYSQLYSLRVLSRYRRVAEPLILTEFELVNDCRCGITHLLVTYDSQK